MLMFQVTVGRRTYCMKHFTVKFIQTSKSEMYLEGIVGRNIANIQESFPRQPGIKDNLILKKRKELRPTLAE